MVDSWWEEFDLLRFKSGLPTRRRLRFRLCPVRKPHVRSLSQCSAAQQRSFLWPADPLVVKSCMRAASTLLELYYWGEERAREEKISRVCLANKGVLWRDGPPSSPSTVPGLFCFLGFFLCVVLFFLFFYFFFFLDVPFIRCCPAMFGATAATNTAAVRRTQPERCDGRIWMRPAAD